MATRIEIQLGLDSIKSANNMNDLLDCLSWQLRGIDPNSGEPYMIAGPGQGMEPDPKMEPTPTDHRIRVSRTYHNISGYYNILSKRFGSNEQKNGLAVFGVDPAAFEAEVESMMTMAQTAETQELTSINDCSVLGQLIEQTVPKLRLLRRDWAI